MGRRKAPAAKGGAPSFEEAIARLEQIVHELEEADLPLERSLAVFEEGVRLARMLHEKLNEAEQKVEILLKDEQGATSAVPFRPAREAAAGGDSEGDDDDAEEEDDADDTDEDGGDGGDGGDGSQRGLF